MTTTANESSPTATDTLTGDYQLDAAHSRIGFVARHAMITKVRGAFNEVEGSGHLDTQLRTFYLTSGLRSRLATWEKHEHADGVLRAQDVPRAWKVTAGDSGMGHTWSTVRLTWGSAQHPTYSYLTVQSDLATQKISDIKRKS